ncbi:hypothetical protein MN116_009093, partial [Schistosoma mekongi]
IFSTVLLALGLKPQITLNQFNVILQESKPPIFLIACISGGLGVISACVGVFGLLKQQKMIIYVHIFILITVTLMEIGIATKVAAVDNQFTCDSLSSSIKNYAKEYNYQMQFDDLQSTGCILVLNEFVQKYVNILMYLCFVFGITQAIYLTMSIMNIRKFDESNSLPV